MDNKLIHAKIESAVPKQSQSGKTYYQVVAGGIVYSCYDTKIKELVGKEIDFLETVKNYDGNIVHYLNLQKPKPSFGKQQSNPDTMILSYAKDIIVTAMQLQTEIPSIKVIKRDMEELFTFFKMLIEKTEVKKEEETKKEESNG